MDQKKIRAIGALVLVAVWACLTAGLWFGPQTDYSTSERRPLAKLPELKAEALFSGKYMTSFEDYTLDQFPLRDTFRAVKSVFHYYVLGQRDNNDLYMVDGYVAKQEYPLNSQSVDYALGRFQHLYEKHLQSSGGRIYMAIVPDKGYYLAPEHGYLSMDYKAMFDQIAQGMPWAQQIDLTDCLNAESYYRTDTHWRQETLLPAAQRLCEALGVSTFSQEESTLVELSRPFYGVYSGQAALPMEPDVIRMFTNPVIDDCTVFDYENGQTSQVYNLFIEGDNDLYDTFLSGSRSLLTIENPNAATDKELIVFRDSFGSAMVPLLVKDYAKVTLVDIRYIQIDVLDRFIEFNGQDVLLMYSTLVLNNSSTIK